jgi:glucose/arabinose dehydrogenase
MPALREAALPALVALVLSAPAHAVPSHRIAGGFDLPVFAAAPTGDPRIFVVEQTGRIRIIESASSGNVLGTPFLDLSGKIAFFGGDDERGLLGMAFPPDYATTGFVYVYYVGPNVGDPENGGLMTVARYTRSAADPNQADPSTERVLLRVPKPPAREDLGGGAEYYHNGGTIAFRPDGKLWLGLGDGAGWLGDDPNNCAQNANSPLGKMLRIDPAAVPIGGVTVAGAASSTGCPGPVPAGNGIEIWARGLRNPWRFSFDRQTGDLYIGDVGQSDREEIDVAPVASLAGAGPNYGWRAFEGSICNPNINPAEPLCSNPGSTRLPAYEYNHVGNGCTGTVIGGYVYRGSEPTLAGRYFFADYCQSFLRSLVWDGANDITGPVTDHLAEFSPAENGGTIDVVTGFGESGAGELLIVDYGNPGFSDGEVFQVPEPGAAGAALAAGAGLCALRRRRCDTT